MYGVFSQIPHTHPLVSNNKNYICQFYVCLSLLYIRYLVSIMQVLKPLTAMDGYIRQI
jgi:hypothetical protein